MNEIVLTSEAEFYLDTAVPNKARIFDYLLDGTFNFKADRVAAQKIIQLIPSLPKWIRLRRAFIQEAAFTLYKNGFKQFLDLGSGMPTENHLHIAVPKARIIYSDTNPVAVSYGQSLFAEFVNIDYIYGDFGQIQHLLQNPAVRRTIDRQEKTAIGLNMLPLTLNQSEIGRLYQELYRWAPFGSQIFQVIQTRSQQAQSKKYEQLLALSQEFRCPMYIYPLDKALALSEPWQPREVVPLTQFLGLPDAYLNEADQEGMGISFYAAFLTRGDA
ncbi:MAG: SAM-dependent methyltransferase [Ardenticatenaceae bacterium]|nr:SAM-dependent methyltransferase [Ardenticatenaceae bacterium]MCB9446070.1 SAM-dependent methyltransferase [Ardenticatenaceae bacterium]